MQTASVATTSSSVKTGANSAFFGSSLRNASSLVSNNERSGKSGIRCEAEAEKKKKADRWGGLDPKYDVSDDQQDITRGRGMVDALFQGASGLQGTQNAVLSSLEYMSTGQKT